MLAETLGQGHLLRGMLEISIGQGNLVILNKRSLYIPGLLGTSKVRSLYRA